MKKILKYAAALAVILPVSCNKEFASPEGNAPEAQAGVSVVMSADVEPMSRMALSETVFSWEEGDVVNLRWANVYTDETLTASYDEEAGRIIFKGTFNNEIPIYDATKGEVQNLYASYAKESTWYTETSIGVVKAISAEQTGKIEDIDDNAVYAAFIKRADIDATFDDEGSVTELAFNADMRPYFSLIKLNVPAEWGLTSITLSADADLAGRLCVNTSKISDNAHNNVFGSGAAQLVNMATEGRSQSITVSRGGELINGDVYFVIAPDEYDSVAGAYGSSAESLAFTLETADGTYEFEASLIEKIQMGEVKSLGTIPVSIKTPKVEAGLICLKETTDFTFSISNPNPECTYYYEIGTSASTCATPTTASAQLDLEAGISPEFSGTHDKIFVKVLAHYTGDGDFRDVLLKAQMRYWKFNNNAPVAEAYRKASELLASNGSQIVTSDGLIVRRRATAALTYGEGTGSIEYNNCIVPFMQVEKNANNVAVYMRTSDFYNNVKSKTINMFYTNDNFSKIERVNTFNGIATKTVIARPDGATTADAKNVSVVWNLGAMNDSYKIAFAPDSKMTCYAHGILEMF